MLRYQNKKIKQIIENDRPREKLIRLGGAGLTNSELLAILLGSGYKGKNVIELAKEILKKYSTFNLTKANYKQLAKEKGVGCASACRILAAFELSNRLFLRQKDNLPIITCPENIYKQVDFLAKKKKENLLGLYLNARNQLIHQEILSIGTINENMIYPREVFEPAFLQNAVSVIVAHNHPSGDLTPSHEDILQTKNLQNAAKILRIDFLDHLIVSEKGFCSLKEQGHFQSC